MANDECRRPYDLRKRQETSERNRSAVVKSARAILERQGFLHFTMAAIAQESGLTRQTVHNLFGAKVDLIEALFDDLADRAGMRNMQVIMQLSDPARMIREYLRLMIRLWSKDRLLIRRIQGLRAIDPELGEALNRRDKRKKMAIGRIVDAIEKQRVPDVSAEERQYYLSILSAFTSFEVFEQLAKSLTSERAITEAVVYAVGRALNLDLLDAAD